MTRTSLSPACELEVCRPRHAEVEETITGLIADTASDPSESGTAQPLAEALLDLLGADRVALFAAKTSERALPRVAVAPLPESPAPPLVIGAAAFPESWRRISEGAPFRGESLLEFDSRTATYKARMDARGTTDVILLPVSDRGRNLGLVSAEYGGGSPFRPCDRLLRTIVTILRRRLGRWLAWRKVERTQELLFSLARCSAAVLKAPDEDALLGDFCTVLVEDQDIEFVLIGSLDGADGRLAVRAVGTRHEEVSASAEVVPGDLLPPTPLALRAAASGGPAVAYRVEYDDVEWESSRRIHPGGGDLACIPVSVDGTVQAVAMIGTVEPDAFGAFEYDLLAQMTDILGRGIGGIRARHALEEASEDLAHLIDSKDQLLATVSHELRTPLTSIVGLSHILEESVGDFDPAEARELAGIVRDQGIQLSHIVEDLLVLAKENAGGIVLRPERIDLLAETRRELEALSATSARSADLDGITGWAMADPTRVRQVVRNLVTNAWQHGGPTVEVEVGHDGHDAWIVVRDDGPAIPSEHSEKVFSPYHHVYRPATMPGSLGLGLSISRAIARRMDGDLTYHHTGEWSVFRFTVPLDVVP